MRKASIGNKNAAKKIIKDKSIQIKVTEEKKANYRALAKYRVTTLSDLVLKYLEEEYQKDKDNILIANTQAR